MKDSEQLIEAIVAESASAEQRAECARLMGEDAAFRRQYVAQMKVHALLQWRAGKVDRARDAKIVSTGRVIPFPGARTRASRTGWLALAAALAILCAIGAVLFRQDAEKTRADVAVEIVHAADARIAGEPAAARAGEVRSFRRLELQAGLIRVRLDSGAIVGVEAPAIVEFLSAMHLRVLAGRITVDADAAHGFTVETARTRVVDLGTRFGVDADADRTDVVVFDGAVELHDRKSPAHAPQRLAQGEAMRIEAAGNRRAIVSIAAGSAPEQWSAGGGGLFRAVRDNRRAQDAPKFYQVVPGGLREDTRAYVDRTHEWNGLETGGLPGFLRGADFIRTFNDDKRETDLQLTVELARPATLYLFLDEKPPAAWVTAGGFTDTGAKIGLDEGPSATRAFTTATGPGASIERVFSIWKLDLPEPRVVQLGAPREGPTGAKAMYGIAAHPLVK